MGDNAPDRLFLLNLVLIRAGSDITALRQLYGELDLNLVSQKTAVGPSTTIARLTRLLVVRSSLYLTTLGPVRGKNRADAPKPHMRPFLFFVYSNDHCTSVWRVISKEVSAAKSLDLLDFA